MQIKYKELKLNCTFVEKHKPTSTNDKYLTKLRDRETETETEYIIWSSYRIQNQNEIKFYFIFFLAYSRHFSNDAQNRPEIKQNLVSQSQQRKKEREGEKKKKAKKKTTDIDNNNQRFKVLKTLSQSVSQSLIHSIIHSFIDTLNQNTHHPGPRRTREKERESSLQSSNQSTK